MAFTAAAPSTGSPSASFASVTLPFLSTAMLTISSPWICLVRASSGYAGGALCKTFSNITFSGTCGGWASFCWAAPEATHEALTQASSNDLVLIHHQSQCVETELWKL